MGLAVAAPPARLVPIILICSPYGPSSRGRYMEEWQFLGIVGAPASLCIKTHLLCSFRVVICDNTNKISFFLRTGQEDMAVLLMARDFDTIEEWQQLLWDNRTAGSEIVKCCYTMFCRLGSSMNTPVRCLGQFGCISSCWQI